jgi:hypothetical protein
MLSDFMPGAGKAAVKTCHLPLQSIKSGINTKKEHRNQQRKEDCSTMSCGENKTSSTHVGISSNGAIPPSIWLSSTRPNSTLHTGASAGAGTVQLSAMSA